MNVSINFQKDTLQEVINEFMDAKRIERYSPATLESYGYILNKFSRFMGRIRFANIDADDIRHWLASLSDFTGKGLCGYYIALSSLWTWAVENHKCNDQIVKQIRKPKYNIKSVVPFSETEVHRLIAACHSVRERAIIMVLLDTGMRRSELTALEIDDWEDLTLRIRHGKGDKERTVPISSVTERMIYHHIRKRVIDEPGIQSGTALFQSAYYTIPLSNNSIRTMLKTLEERSGVENVHPHRFRHTFAITYLRNGGDIYTLQKILGHSSLEMVKHYLAIATSDVERTHAKASPVKVWHLTG